VSTALTTPLGPVTSADSMPSRLRLVINRLARRLRQESGAGITPSQFSALATVDCRGPVSLRELAEIERVAPPSMTRISFYLEQAGLIARHADAQDRRIARMAITEAGHDLLEASRTRRDAYLASRLQGLPDADLQALARAVPILERLIEEQDR
jgi:DNA-binding MarR family transcriptional regulator